ncbi:MAG: ABC transporter permease subunit [Kiloniellales bacterium]|nr:ABC transporter permease subunit [Kiloniellales bacterium]
MRNLFLICRRELVAYFSSPLAYIFIVVFLAMSGGFTFFLGAFLDRGQANLSPFFQFHPWLYLVLVPALGMRLWAEERKTGTIEFLMTLPVSTGQAVVGKFLAAWIFAGIALALTFPLWITVNYLGQPDNGVILGAYLGSWLMAGGFLAISACMSALTSNQVIAFVLAVTVCFLFMMSGLDLVQALFRGWAPETLIDAVARLSFLSNFLAISQGVIDLRNIVFFLSLIGVGLFINTALVEIKKGA